METLSAKEFFEQLKTNSLKPSFTIVGIVKKSENDSEILFATNGNFGKWTKIPSSMIESVNILKSFFKETETFVMVKLHLKPPTTPEGRILFELLSSTRKEEMNVASWCRSKSTDGFSHCDMEGKFYNEGMGNFGHHFGCGYHHSHCVGLSERHTCGCEYHHCH